MEEKKKRNPACLKKGKSYPVAAGVKEILSTQKRKKCSSVASGSRYFHQKLVRIQMVRGSDPISQVTGEGGRVESLRRRGGGPENQLTKEEKTGIEGVNWDYRGGGGGVRSQTPVSYPQLAGEFSPMTEKTGTGFAGEKIETVRKGGGKVLWACLTKKRGETRLILGGR